MAMNHKPSSFARGTNPRIRPPAFQMHATGSDSHHGHVYGPLDPHVYYLLFERVSLTTSWTPQRDGFVVSASGLSSTMFDASGPWGSDSSLWNPSMKSCHLLAADRRKKRWNTTGKRFKHEARLHVKARPAIANPFAISISNLAAFLSARRKPFP